MYQVKLSVINLDKLSDKEFNKAANEYVENITKVQELHVDVPHRKVEGTRGDLPLWANIVITAASSGAFTALYTLAKDLIDLYNNVDVELTFPDGSSMTFKNLTSTEAKELLKKHLEKKIDLH